MARFVIGPLALRIAAAVLLADVSSAVIVEPGSRVIAAFAVVEAVLAGVCLWLAHCLAQVKRAERRRKERI